MTWISTRVIRGNRGDIASRYCILNQLMAAGVPIEAVFASDDRHLPPELRPLRMPYGALHNLWPGWRGLAALWRSRVVLWAGGLDLQDDSSIIKLVHTWLVFLSYRLFGLEIFLAHQGAGPLTTRTGKWFAMRILNFVTVALVRDSGSYELLSTLMDSRKLLVGGDGIFLDEPWRSQIRAVAPVRRTSRPIVGINLRLWFHFSSSWVPYQFARSRYLERARRPMDEIVSCVISFVRHVRGQHDAHVVLISMYEPGVESWEDDRSLLEKVKTAFSDDDDVKVHEGNPSIVDLCGEVADLDLMVGMRLHSTLLALRAGVPAIHLAYTLKGHDIYADLALEDWIVSIERLSRDATALTTLADRLLADPSSRDRTQNTVTTMLETNRAALAAAIEKVGRE